LKPLELEVGVIHVAQRYDFILVTNQTAGSYWIRAVMNTNCFSADNPALNPDVFAILQYNTVSFTVPNTSAWDPVLDPICRDLNSSELIPLNPPPLLEPDLFVRFDLSFQPRGNSIDLGIVNGTSWVPLTGTNTLEIASKPNGNFSVQGVDTTDFDTKTQFVYSIPEIHTVEYMVLTSTGAEISFLLNNLDEGTHPFHFHGHRFWIMAEGDGVYNESIPLAQVPPYRDTLSIQGYGYARIRFVSDNPGAWICKHPTFDVMSN